MKISLEVDSSVNESEVVIRCNDIDANIMKLQKYISDFNNTNEKIIFYKEDREFYFSVDSILFFETTLEGVVAHTDMDFFYVKYKLYELEELLPNSFMRVSKSTIINARKIYSIRKNLAGASRVEFENTAKYVYVSRKYYPLLKEKLISISMKGK